MVVEYGINELVLFEDEIYRIIGIYQMNHQLIDPHIYEIIDLEYKGPVKHIRGALLSRPNAMEILYGK